MAGDKQTGVQIQQMKESLDTGDILLSEFISIGDKDTTGSLFQTISRIGASMWPRVLRRLNAADFVHTRKKANPTYAAKSKKMNQELIGTCPL